MFITEMVNEAQTQHSKFITAYTRWIVLFAGTEDGFCDDLTLFYGSTHEKDNYPGSGHDPSPLVGNKAKSPRDRRIVNRTLDPGPKSRKQFKEKWQEILSEMELFQPELVLISAGTCSTI